MRCRLLILIATLAYAGLAVAQAPADVLTFVRSAADSLANQDPQSFCDKFDSSMPGYAALRDEIQALLAAHEVASTIEVVNNDGDEQHQNLQLDWLLSVKDVGNRRQVIRCRVERKGKTWKFTAFEPVEFFKYD